MTTHRLFQVVVLIAVLAVSCAALLTAQSQLNRDVRLGPQPLFGRMVDSSVVQLELELQEHREVTYLLQRMH